MNDNQLILANYNECINYKCILQHLDKSSTPMIMLSRLLHVLINKNRTMRHGMQTNEESRIIFEIRSLYNLVAIGNKSTFQAFQYTQYRYDPTYLSFTNAKNKIFNSLYFCFVIIRNILKLLT